MYSKLEEVVYISLNYTYNTNIRPLKEEITMIQIIAGEKGKGKTKIIINKVNEEVNTANGNVVYLDKSNKHMYELSNRIRLINVREYLIQNFNEFNGFICGILSQDHDVERVYVDSFLKVACLSEDELDMALNKLQVISEHFNVDFVLCISINSKEINEDFKENILVAL